jgi:hypothetical protein
MKSPGALFQVDVADGSFFLVRRIVSGNSRMVGIDPRSSGAVAFNPFFKRGNTPSG